MLSKTFLILLYLFLYVNIPVFAQKNTARKIEIKVDFHPNIETWFILERLAVEHLGRYGYIKKETDNSHQPLVKAAFERFKIYKDSSIVFKTAKLLDTLRQRGMFNAEVIGYLLYTKPFPEKGFLYPPHDFPYLDAENNKVLSALMKEYITDMQKFFVEANVGSFIKKHKSFYKGAVREVRKDVPEDIGTYMEQFYGEDVIQFSIVVNPTMPIAPVEGDFRGIGPMVLTGEGKIPYMVLSTSIMLPPQARLSDYKKFGYDNPTHTEMMVVHEFGHSFVNPALIPLIDKITQDSALFTPSLAAYMQPQDITDWIPCVIEHVVRLGEIRVAVAMKDKQRADRLRKLHVGEYKFIFLPAMEEKVKEYENNRRKYKNFADFLPELLTVFKEFTPAKVDQQLKAGKVN